MLMTKNNNRKPIIYFRGLLTVFYTSRLRPKFKFAEMPLNIMKTNTKLFNIFFLIEQKKALMARVV